MDRTRTTKNEQMIKSIETIESLELEVSELQVRLSESEKQSDIRLRALECLCWVTYMPSCDICLENLADVGVWWMLKTACGHSVCTGCWKQHTREDMSRPIGKRLKRCPWNTCMEKDSDGNTCTELIDGVRIGVVGSCSTVGMFNRDDALDEIVNMRAKLAKKYKNRIFPNVFESNEPPAFVSGFLLT
jgi:hypothetical protein